MYSFASPINTPAPTPALANSFAVAMEQLRQAQAAAANTAPSNH